MSRIYLASSWRNEHQPAVLATLRNHGHEVYDFRNPQRVEPWPQSVVPHTERCSCSSCSSGRRVGWPILGAPAGSGFSWKEIDPDWKDWSPYGWLAALDHPIARDAFGLDFGAMKWSDTCVLLLPAGPSAAIEAGWCKGSGRRLIVCALGLREPDLMYAMADAIVLSVGELLDALRTVPVRGPTETWLGRELLDRRPTGSPVIDMSPPCTCSARTAHNCPVHGWPGDGHRRS